MIYIKKTNINRAKLLQFKQHTVYMHTCILDKQEVSHILVLLLLMIHQWHQVLLHGLCNLRNNPHVTPSCCHGNLIILFLIEDKILKKRESEGKIRAGVTEKKHV